MPAVPLPLIGPPPLTGAHPPVGPAPTDSPTARRSALPVVLVSMPFVAVDRPSIQLGLLKAITESSGFPTRTLHAGLDFAARIGSDRYALLAQHRKRMLGEWLFSVAAFGDDAPDPTGRLLDDIADELSYLGGDTDEVIAWLHRVRRDDVPAYLDTLVEQYDWDGVKVVGFSCTFQQTAASVALARRLKHRDPHLITVFGGANLDGDMGRELVRAVDVIDLAVIGEGDVALPGLLGALADGTDPGAVAGVARCVDGRLVATDPAPPLGRLDDLPLPDYAEYFERAETLGLLPVTGHRTVWLPFESARGCWWGAKHHCTFCGLNGVSMRFRAKSADRVLEELAHQARRYRSFRFEAVDNIMDTAYLRELFPALIESAADYDIFYEIKANLTRPQLKLLADAGVRHLQPGLESLNSNVLRLMRKGIHAAQNVNLLRWARYYGITVAWNLLWGFDGETDADYADQVAAIPHLVHLQPPLGASRIWMERFSPLFTTPEKFHIRERVPERSYRYVYPRTVDLERVAYFFDYETTGGLPAASYEGLSQAAADWSQAWQQDAEPVLTFWSAPGFLQIYDGRQPGAEGTYTFDGRLAEIYLACSDRPSTAAAVRQRLGPDLQVAEIQEVFEEFHRRGLMFLDESRALALALPAVSGR